MFERVKETRARETPEGREDENTERQPLKINVPPGRFHLVENSLFFLLPLASNEYK